MEQNPEKMQRYIAFLRAINVGGHTVKMASLRKLFEDLEFSNVETFIASGNVIFEASAGNAPSLEKQIEAHLLKFLGYAVATFIRTPTELAEIASYQPFPASIEGTQSPSLYIGFLSRPPRAETVENLIALRNPVDDFNVHGREFYWLCQTRISESAVSGARLEKTIGMPLTLRNVTTVKKMAAKYGLQNR